MSEHIGTKVSIPGTRGYGILRYYGSIDGKSGTFGGIELIGPIAATRGKNSGSVNGVQYFNVQHPMTGLFLPFERLKSVNTHLLKMLRQNSSLLSDSSTDTTRTPSPLSRGSLSSFQYNGKFGTKNGLTSPKFPEQSMVIPKRNSVKGNGTHIDQNSKATYENSNPLITSRCNLSVQDYNSIDEEKLKLEQELKELTLNYENNKLEMAEKIRILDDLRTTVNEIQPLLEEYENELSEKDKKLLKQKAEFEKARGEWRQSLDLMVSTQQENEHFYEQKISELNAKVEEMSGTTFSKESGVVEYESMPNSTNELADILMTVENLKNENSTLKNSTNKKSELHKKEIVTLTERLLEFQEKKDTIEYDKLEALKKENRDLQDKIDEMQRELTEMRTSKISLQSDLDKLQTDIANKDKKLLGTLQDKNTVDDVNGLLKGINSVDLNKDKDTIPIMKKEIDALKHELSLKPQSDSIIQELKDELEMRPTFEELGELQTTLDELDTLYKNELSAKDNSLQDCLAEKDRIQRDLEEAVKKIQNLTEIKPQTSEIETKLDTTKNKIELPIFVPKKPIDPSLGRNDWCGLCERDGHSSIKCPYENDMF